MFLIQDTSRWESVGQLICAILIFLFVLALAYLTARIAGNFQSNVLNRRSNIQVIEVFRLSNNKLIEIVKIGNRYLALAICKDSVTLLTELDDMEVKEQETKLEPIHFKDIFDKMKNERKNQNKQN